MWSQVILERFLWRWVLSWDRVTIEFGWVQDKPPQVGSCIHHKPSQKSKIFFIVFEYACILTEHFVCMFVIYINSCHL